MAFTDENPAPPVPADVTDDRRVARNYPEQPPVIPRTIRDYQITTNTNRSGVRATCPDCHVPHPRTDKIARKMQASKEVWGKIFGTIEPATSSLPCAANWLNMNGRG